MRKKAYINPATTMVDVDTDSLMLFSPDDDMNRLPGSPGFFNVRECVICDFDDQDNEDDF